jgi:predicted small secreted protein
MLESTLGRTKPHKRIISMRMKLSIALTLLVLIGAAPLLGACHTTAGAGEDISSTGHAITHSAEKNTP